MAAEALSVVSLSGVEAQAEALASELSALAGHVRAVRAADEHVAQWTAGFGKYRWRWVGRHRGQVELTVRALTVRRHHGCDAPRVA